jgi:hypothetical protein
VPHDFNEDFTETFDIPSEGVGMARGGSSGAASLNPNFINGRPRTQRFSIAKSLGFGGDYDDYDDEEEEAKWYQTKWFFITAVCVAVACKSSSRFSRRAIY